MEKVINFPIHPEFSQKFIDQIDKLEEQTTEIYDLIGYQDSPKFKILKGGLE
jgi:hypothetical protein